MLTPCNLNHSSRRCCAKSTICPGRNSALLEMKMAMAMLLGRFEIESVETPDGGEARERLSFTMTPEGLRMRLRERAS
jgi:cytochrome P450